MIANASTDHNGMGSVKDAARHLAHDASSDAAELGGDLAVLKDEIVSAVKQAFASARETGGEAYENAVDRTTDAAKRLGDSVTANPLTSIVVAAGVGLLLGLFMLRKH